MFNPSCKALSRLGVHARAPCTVTEKDVVQTPFCLRSNCVLVRQFSTHHSVYCIARRHEVKACQLTGLSPKAQ